MREGLMMDDYPLSLTAWCSAQSASAPQRRSSPGGRTAPSAGRRSAPASSARGGSARRWRSSGSSRATPWRRCCGTSPSTWSSTSRCRRWAPCIHTLNPRLHPDELSFIVNDAEDRAIVVDESLLSVFETFHERARLRAGDRRVAFGAGARRLPRLRVAARRRASRWSGPPTTSGAPRRCVTRRARPAARRASSTRTARWCCTRWSRRCPTSRAISRRDTLMPVVPMFHANAWGLPYTGDDDRLPGSYARPETRRDQRARPAGRRARDGDGRGSDGLDGGPAGARRRARPLGSERAAAIDRRRLGRAREHAEGLRSPRADRRPRLGDDRDLAAGSVCRPPLELDDASEEERYDYRARQGIASPFVEIRARGEDGQFVPWDDLAMGELEVRGSVGRARLSPRSRAPRSSPTTAGLQLATWSRSTPGATSASATDPRTSSSPAASGSRRWTWRTC